MSATLVSGHGLGWKPQLPDFRDFPAPRATRRPDQGRWSFRAQLPDPPLDQGALGSCTANAVARVLDYALLRQGLPPVLASRLYIYYYSRLLEGTVREDAGAVIRDVIKVVAKRGAPPEAKWPYVPDRFRLRPSFSAERGTQQRAITYMAVAQDAATIESLLAQNFPVIVGIAVYDSFESALVAHGGLVPLPAPHEKQLGGHCMFICGYDRDYQGDGPRYEVANSWGPDWGDHGYCWLPYDYLHNPGLASDFWTIEAAKVV